MLSYSNRYADIIKPIIKMVISLIVLAVVSSIILNIVGFRFPGWPFSLSELATFFIGLVMISIVLVFGKELSVNVKRAFHSYPELFSIVYSMVQVLAVYIAYISFDGVILPFLNSPIDLAWIYPLIFLAVGLIPGLTAATTLINNIDKWIDKLHGSLAIELTCQNCHSKVSADARFCGYCGVKLKQ